MADTLAIENLGDAEQQVVFLPDPDIEVLYNLLGRERGIVNRHHANGARPGIGAGSGVAQHHGVGLAPVIEQAAARGIDIAAEAAVDVNLAPLHRVVGDHHVLQAGLGQFGVVVGGQRRRAAIVILGGGAAGKSLVIVQTLAEQHIAALGAAGIADYPGLFLGYIGRRHPGLYAVLAHAGNHVEQLAAGAGATLGLAVDQAHPPTRLPAVVPGQGQGNLRRHPAGIGGGRAGALAELPLGHQRRFEAAAAGGHDTVGLQHLGGTDQQ